MVDYLPSARQVQRAFGGMSELRQRLGYGKIDYTKGQERKLIAKQAFKNGLDAELNLEIILTEKFGEPYVHTQKRYGTGTKNRYDFFIYAQNTCFGIDIFSTTRKEYVGPNIRHKIHRYKVSPDVNILFIADGIELTEDDIGAIVRSTPLLANHPNMKLMNIRMLEQYISSLNPLEIPENFIGIN